MAKRRNFMRAECPQRCDFPTEVCRVIISTKTTFIWKRALENAPMLSLIDKKRRKRIAHLEQLVGKCRRVRHPKKTIEGLD